MKIVRRWKRDGSTNFMDLDIAVQNIVQNREDLTKFDIAMALMGGATVETPKARFRQANAADMERWRSGRAS